MDGFVIDFFHNKELCNLLYALKQQAETGQHIIESKRLGFQTLIYEFLILCSLK